MSQPRQCLGSRMNFCILIKVTYLPFHSTNPSHPSHLNGHNSTSLPCQPNSSTLIIHDASEFTQTFHHGEVLIGISWGQNDKVEKYATLFNNGIGYISIFFFTCIRFGTACIILRRIYHRISLDRSDRISKVSIYQTIPSIAEGHTGGS